MVAHSPGDPRRGVLYARGVGLLIVPASAVAIAAGALIALRLPLRGALERLVGIGVATQAFITLVLLTCGLVVRSLEAGTLIGVTAIGFSGVAGVTLRGDGRAIVATAAAQLWAQARGALRLRTPGRRLVTALVAFGLLALAWRLVLALRLPTLDYDGFSYHLVTVDVWLQGSVLGRVPQRIWSDGYPANGELVTLWLMAFSRTDALADLTGWLPLFLAGVAVTGVARELGARRDWAFVAGAVFVITPAVIAASNTTYVDNLAIADLSAAWFVGLRATRDGPWPRRLALLGLMGAAMGLGLGTKLSLAIPVAAIGAVVVLGIARVDRRGAFQAAALIGGLALLLGGWWYVRDLVVFGNPVWPFTFGPFQGVGRMDDLIVQTPPELIGLGRLAQIATSWIGDFGATSYIFAPRVGGFGVLWLPVVAVAVVGAFRLVRERRWTVLFGIVAPVVVTLLLMPMPWWARLTTFALVAGLAIGAATVSRWSVGYRSGAMLVAVVAALFSLGIATRTANVVASTDGSSPGISRLLRLVAADDATRARLGLWAECAGFDQMPPGSRVATDGFNLVHAVVGPGLERTLLPTVDPTSDPATLLAEARREGAGYLVLVSNDAIAAAINDPTHFTSLGPVCRGTRLYAVVPGG